MAPFLLPLPPPNSTSWLRDRVSLSSVVPPGIGWCPLVMSLLWRIIDWLFRRLQSILARSLILGYFCGMFGFMAACCGSFTVCSSSWIRYWLCYCTSSPPPRPTSSSFASSLRCGCLYLSSGLLQNFIEFLVVAFEFVSLLLINTVNRHTNEHTPTRAALPLLALSGPLIAIGYRRCFFSPVSLQRRFRDVGWWCCCSCWWCCSSSWCCPPSIRCSVVVVVSGLLVVSKWYRIICSLRLLWKNVAGIETYVLFFLFFALLGTPDPPALWGGSRTLILVGVLFLLLIVSGYRSSLSLLLPLWRRLCFRVEFRVQSMQLLLHRILITRYPSFCSFFVSSSVLTLYKNELLIRPILFLSGG